jgi:hypothetical protein
VLWGENAQITAPHVWVIGRSHSPNEADP